MTVLNTSLRHVPKIYRNKRIYPGEGGISATTGIGGITGGGTSFTAGNGISIEAGVIAMSSPYTGAFIFTGKVTSQGGLDVTGGSMDVTATSIVPLVMNTASAQSLIQIKQGGSDKGFFGYSNDGDTGIAIYNAALDTVNLMVTDAGKVGILNSSPAHELDVTGDVRVTGQIGVGAAPLGDYAGYFLSESADTVWSNTMLCYDSRAMAQGVGGGITFGGKYTTAGGLTTAGFFRVEKENAEDSEYGFDMLIGNRIDNEVPATVIKLAASDGRVQFQSSLDSLDTTFSSGFTGAGWKLDKTGSGGSATYGLEVDSLRVRGSMTVYELILNQIRATNGSLWVSDAARIETVTDPGAAYDYDITTDTDGGNMPIPFAVNDFLRCQQFDGRNVRYYVLQVMVINTSAGTMECDRVHGTSTPAAFDSLVRMGNQLDSARQGAIYLTASDSNNPYIEVLSGVNSAISALGNFRKARLGNLTGITDPEFGALSGYGLWSENAYLTGSIVANAGLIAGWTIAGNYIRKDYMPGQYDWLYMSHAGGGELPSGFGLTMGSSAGIGEVKYVHMGELRVKDTYNTIDTGNFGFEIIKKTGSSTYAHVVRFGQDEALIAGWNIDNDAIYTGTKHTADNYSAGGLSLAASGGIHSKNFYMNDDGEVGIRGNIVYALVNNTGTTAILTHPGGSTIETSWTQIAQIALGPDLQDNKTLKIYIRYVSSDPGVTSWFRVYRGSTPVGTVRSVTGTTPLTYTQEIAGWNAGEDIRVYAYQNASPFNSAMLTDFEIQGVQVVPVNELTGSYS